MVFRWCCARDDERPVFLEGSGIDEAVDVLARHSVAQLPAPGDRVRPVLVQPEGVAVVVFAQVVADVVRVQSRHGGDGPPATSACWMKTMG